METELHNPGQPGHGCCTRWRERALIRMDKADRAPSDVDHAFLSTARCRRRKMSRTWTWTWMDAATCAWARTETAQGHPSLLRSLSPTSSVVLSSSFPLHPASPPPTLTKVTRDDDGAPGHGPLAENSSPAACCKGPWRNIRCCAPTWKCTLSASSCIASPLKTPLTRCTVT